LASLHRLSNGVRVVCDPISGFETLALSVVCGRGSRWESRDRSGWAHLLEHMVFKGAGQRSARDIVEVIEAAGGNINAATGYERTSYQVRALKGGLPLGMAVIADLILRPTLAADELEREKSVIAQEIAEAADTPDDLVFDLAQSAAFGDTALGRPILGDEASLKTARPASLEAFRALIYAPDRIVVSAAGAVDEDELLDEAERAFGHLPPVAPAPAPAPAPFVGGDHVRRQRLEQANLVFMLPACDARDPAYFASRLFAEALGGGMSSRLFQEVREKQGLAYAIDAYLESYSDTGVLGIFAGCAAADAGKAARLAAQQVIALTEGATADELSRSKAQLKGGLFMARESALARAEQSAGQILLLDRLIPAAELSERIDAVTLSDFRAVGERSLGPGRSARAVLGPAPAAAAAEAFAGGLAA
jgi:predicted Zn-dependent peptidase